MLRLHELFFVPLRLFLKKAAIVELDIHTHGIGIKVVSVICPVGKDSKVKL